MTESYSLTPGQEASAEWDWDRQLGKYTPAFSPYGEAQQVGG